MSLNVLRRRSVLCTCKVPPRGGLNRYNHIRSTVRYVSLAGWHSKKSHGRRRVWKKNNTIKDQNIASILKQQNIINSSNQNYYNRSIPFSPRRFFNPWDELANIVPSEELLSDKVESTTRTFGIVAALMGSLAAALLTFNPYDGYDAQRKNEPIKSSDNLSIDGKRNNMNDTTPIKRRNTLNFIEHVTFTHHVSGTSLLVSWGIEPKKLDDIYTACCAGSFYSGVLTTVLSSVINAWLAATPSGGVRSFVRVHSWYIVALPALLTISTSLAGTALFIGLDREHGTPVSYVGLGGTIIGGTALGLVNGRGWLHTYKSLTAAVKRGGK